MTEPELLTINGAAERIGVTPRQIRHWIDTGDLLFVPVGRRVYVEMADIKDMIAKKKTRKAKKPKDANGNEEEEIELNE